MRIKLSNRLAAVFGSEDAERWAGALVIVTDHKVRVRRASAQLG